MKILIDKGVFTDFLIFIVYVMNFNHIKYVRISSIIKVIWNTNFSVGKL